MAEVEDSGEEKRMAWVDNCCVGVSCLVSLLVALCSPWQKRQKCQNPVFRQNDPFFLVRRRLRRRRFSFLYKVIADCDRASEGPFTLFFMGKMVDARFATLVGQANH